MKTVNILKLAASTLVLGVGFMGAGPIGLSTLASASDTAQSKEAEAAFAKALRALKNQKFEVAMVQAEKAVAFAPDRAEYRFALGQAYLGLGRLSSAETAFGDVIALDPSNARAGLNRALMQIALGRSENALATLDQHRELMTAADFGLAVALAGDTAGAVQILEAAVRAPGANVKTRQNLALAYALDSQWAKARITAAIDLAPDQLDQRMTDWARFSRPASASDQVASLMGVRPVFDPGQPERLALIRQPQQMAAVAAPVETKVEEVPAEAPAVAAVEEPSPAFEIVRPADAPVPVAVAPVAPAARSVTIALDDPEPVAIPFNQEVAPAKQAVVPAKQVVVPAKRTAAPAKVMASPAPKFPRAVESGRFVVQLGAFSNEGRAQIGWDRAVGRTRHLSSYPVATARVLVSGASLYRLSVTGFTSRAVASQVCTRIKASGGECFVRSIAGDKPMQWVSRGGTRLASR